MTRAPVDRKAERQSVLKMAKVMTGTSLYDCIIIDFSTKGARIRFGSATALPDAVSLQLPDGTSYDAIRRWTRGDEVGLEFLADTSLGREAREQAWLIREQLIHQPFRPLESLKRADYFDDEPIRVAAVAVFAALVELETVLKRRGLPPSTQSTATTTASIGPLTGTGPLQSMAAGSANIAGMTQRLQPSTDP